MKTLLYYFFNSYRLNLPCALNCRGPRTQLQTTRPLRTQLQSLLILYDPKKQFYTSIRFNASIPSFLTSEFIFLTTQSLGLFIQSHGPRTMGRSLKLTLHYKINGGQPYDSFTTSRSAPTKCGVFTSDLVKIWALSPKTCLRGSCAQHVASREKYSQFPFCLLSILFNLHSIHLQGKGVKYFTLNVFQHTPYFMFDY